MLTLREIKARTEPFFKEKGVPNPVLDFDLLLARVLGVKRLELYLDLDRPLTEAQLEELRPWVKRRANREPLQHIMGILEFGGLELCVDSRALIPRPETEELLEWIWGQNNPPARILDLGTGSGALSLSLAKAFPEATVTATDVSEDALALASENADRNGLGERVNFLQGSWWEPITEGSLFELIVSNPPYLTEAEFESAESEVKEFEPTEALVSGVDGMDALRVIFADAKRFLAPEGMLALETGIAQSEALNACAEEAGLTGETIEDFSGRPRFYIVRHKSS